MGTYSRKHILAEIRRTAKTNGGKALGWRRFEQETGVRHYDWYGTFWPRWNDAVREAGFEPNRISEGYDDMFLLYNLVRLTRSLEHVPTEGDLRLAARNVPSFPSKNAFGRLGLKPQRVCKVIEYCGANPGNEDVAALWREVAIPNDSEGDEALYSTGNSVGYVYMLKHGSRREYKIGRTNNALRREGEIGIQLPEKVKPLHYIETDDPAGVEAYWHNRFASKRKEGEWFELSAEDVRAFKRWKRIY